MNMMEEMCKWRLKKKATLATINEESAKRAAKDKGVGYRRGRSTPPGLLSQQSVLYTLREWYPTKAPEYGTITKWMSIVNCDNATYFFRRLGEREWGNVEFTQQEITTEFIRTYTFPAMTLPGRHFRLETRERPRHANLRGGGRRCRHPQARDGGLRGKQVWKEAQAPGKNVQGPGPQVDSPARGSEIRAEHRYVLRGHAFKFHPQKHPMRCCGN